MANKYRITEAELEAYVEQLREKARPQLRQEAVERIFKAARAAALKELLSVNADERWALEQEFKKPIEEFLVQGTLVGLGEQKLWLQDGKK